MVSTTITFNKSGVQPPVFVAGSFSQWAPIEMSVKPNELDGSVQNQYIYQANLEPGQYQYKFRLGPGDWWVLDESSPSVHDESGNVNNIIEVKPETSKIVAPESAEVITKIPANVFASERIPTTDENSQRVLLQEKKSQAPFHAQIEENTEQEVAENKPEKVASNAKPDKVISKTHFGGDEGSKEDPIPDIAPPPYTPSLADTGSELTSAPLKSDTPSVEDTNGRDDSRAPGVKGAEQGESGTQPWIDRVGGGNMALVVAAILIPVAISYLWFR